MKTCEELFTELTTRKIKLIRAMKAMIQDCLEECIEDEFDTVEDIDNFVALIKKDGLAQAIHHVNPDALAFNKDDLEIPNETSHGFVVASDMMWDDSDINKVAYSDEVWFEFKDTDGYPSYKKYRCTDVIQHSQIDDEMPIEFVFEIVR